MSYCKYHPLDGAAWFCAQCMVCQCDRCVDDDPKHRGKCRCFVCGSLLESLGAAHTVEPFWRRLREAFFYPLNASSMSLVVGMSLLILVAQLLAVTVLPAILLYLFAAGALLKYSLTCLERTALGEMKAPEVFEAYHGGIKLLFKLLCICVALMLVLMLVVKHVGPAAGGILAVLMLIASPAILIRFAQTESVREAINPLGVFGLINAIGLPYGLLIAFIGIMMGSVAVLQEWAGRLPAFSMLLQLVISNYYTLVVFHLMGYMLFQYQAELGYSARIDEPDEQPLQRTDKERLLARIEVLLKEGDYETMIGLYYQAFRQYPDEPAFFDKFFDLLYLCKKVELMKDFAGVYLAFMRRKQRVEKLASVFKQILAIAPDYLPDDPMMRLVLSEQLKARGDLRGVVRLLNGLHKQHPRFPHLVEAYELMSLALDGLPGMQPQALKCRQLVDQLKRKAQADEAARAASVLQIAAAPVVPKAHRPAPAPAQPMALELVPIEPREERD